MMPYCGHQSGINPASFFGNAEAPAATPAQRASVRLGKDGGVGCRLIVGACCRSHPTVDYPSGTLGDWRSFAGR